MKLRSANLTTECSPHEYQELAANKAFQELLSWMEKRFEAPHLEALAPNKVLPNYGEVAASNAAMFRVVRETKRFVANRSGKDYKAEE